MKSKNNIEKIVQEFVKKDLIINLSIQEKAAFKMLQQQKIRKLLNKDEHQVGTGSVKNDLWRDQQNSDRFFVDL